MRKLITAAGVMLALGCGSALAADTKASAQGNTGGTEATTKSTSASSSDRGADRKLLADVRRAVVKDKSLSKAAHNVKMDAKGGVITLSGGVKNDEEKSKIEDIAKQVAGVSSVENKLTVGGSKTDKVSSRTSNSTTGRTQ